MPRPRHYEPRHNHLTPQQREAILDASRAPLKRIRRHNGAHWGRFGHDEAHGHNWSKISRLLDRQLLDLDPFTDTICVTTKGAELAAGP